MRWDGRTLRSKLRDSAFSGSLSELVRGVVTVAQIPGASYPARFFEVELVKLSRSNNDVLMNEQAVRAYLSQVAPLPFDPSFAFAKSVGELLEGVVPPPIRISVSDSDEPLFHRARSKFAISKSVTEHLSNIETLELKNADGDVLAVGWIAHHSYRGAVPRVSGLGGIRMRRGNLQVGSDTALAPYFSEGRFASWAVGELHVVHPRIIPNGRRDDFEPSRFFGELQEELRTLGAKITQRIRASSEGRRTRRRVELALDSAWEWLVPAAKRGANASIRYVCAGRATDYAEQAQSLVNARPWPKEEVARFSESVREIRSKASKISSALAPRISKRSTGYIAISAILQGALKPAKALAYAETVAKSLSRK
jgi:molecular chaperone HtpG